MQYYSHHVWKFQNNTFSTMQYTALSIQKGQNRKLQKFEFKLKFAFQWDNFNFICHAKQTPFRYKKYMKFTVGQTSD